jgi:hypothetical protein
MAYARYVAANTAYPNDNIAEGQQILVHYGALLHAMSKAGCPGTAHIVPLPGN